MLKGWKKDNSYRSKDIYTDQIVFRKKSRGKALTIQRYDAWGNKKNDTYNINIVGVKLAPRQIGSFKTKTQAIKFAKAYMRSH